MLSVIRPGLQTTLQGAPRTGYRHMGVPYAGPADELSMALANRLVGNHAYETSLEITFGGFEAEVTANCTLAVAGASDGVELNGTPAPLHESLPVQAGTTVSVAPPSHGMRAYLAIHSGFAAEPLLGSTSTYLPAACGGLGGRARVTGDELHPR